VGHRRLGKEQAGSGSAQKKRSGGGANGLFIHGEVLEVVAAAPIRNCT
jgi:hypothetical protein